MSGVLVDSSVLIDIATRDAGWFAWSAERLEQLGRDHDLLVNQIIYAEIILAFGGSGDAPLDLPSIFVRRDLPWGASILAAQAHAEYRRRGGARSAILADFLIAAHAQVEGLLLLTRDPARARGAFTNLEIVSPG